MRRERKSNEAKEGGGNMGRKYEEERKKGKIK